MSLSLVMSQPAVNHRPQMERARSLVVPREHGAWGMLLIPLITGAGVGLIEGGRVLPLVLLTVAALALFWMRTPVESLLGNTPMRAQNPAERHHVMVAIAGLGVVAIAALAALLWGGRNLGLVAIGSAAALAFAVQAGLKPLGRGMRMNTQLIGSMGLVCTAPAAYYVITGHLDAHAFGLWLANWMFAGNQIHYVQVRIHAARATGWREKLSRARGFFFGHFALTMALVLAWRLGLLPGLVLLAFAPMLFRGLRWFFQPPKTLNVRRLGWTELLQGTTFAVLLIVFFRFGA